MKKKVVRINIMYYEKKTKCTGLKREGINVRESVGIRGSETDIQSENSEMEAWFVTQTNIIRSLNCEILIISNHHRDPNSSTFVHRPLPYCTTSVFP